MTPTVVRPVRVGGYEIVSGHRKSTAQRLYDKLLEYVKRLKRYARHIEICGEKRNIRLIKYCDYRVKSSNPKILGMATTTTSYP